ncbi:aminopeptidase [Vibrio panuliri]|uniref:Peptidase M29 n=1 Tax=Vibrio panuliri TaxID=1381081 RepID=A0ABX3FLJ6_9VIBR|nr:aminopeptidase [Vibrio panuliri]KAB1458046.1 aminopeptidase [Vibrio panuliri]OLQ95089.1 peptidase M29 [Vibrio panuliri]
MTDQRIEQIAQMLVHHSLQIQTGEKVMIAAMEECSLPYAKALNRAIVQAGGFPQVQFVSEEMRSDLMRFGQDEQISWIPEIERYGMEWADVYIALRGASNLYQHWDIPVEKKALSQKTQGIISTARWQKTRWCLLRIPNLNMAHQAKIDEHTLMEQFYRACLLDWSQHTTEWQRLCQRLEQGSAVRIVSANTDLSFSTQGRKWVVFDGRANMPDGEIATAPLTETINGYIEFENPGVLGGQLMENLRLEWQCGVLVSATCSTNQNYLNNILATDEGAKLIGEFAFGLNPEMTTFTNDILVDEKIAGTLHIALGRAYPECGGTNISAIHWDIIKDTRIDGKVYLDGELIFERGQFLI